MSDGIRDAEGKRYVEIGYLKMANATAKRRGERIRDLESQLASAQTAKQATERELEGIRQCLARNSEAYSRRVVEISALESQLATEREARQTAEAKLHTWNRAAADSGFAGSEYHDDPGNVFARVQQLKDSMLESVKKRQAAERERNSARIECDRLEGLAEAQDKALAAVTRNTDSLRAQLDEARKQSTEKDRRIEGQCAEIKRLADERDLFHKRWEQHLEARNRALEEAEQVAHSHRQSWDKAETSLGFEPWARAAEVIEDAIRALKEAPRG